LSRTIGIRLDEETEELLVSLSETMNLKKSQLLRKAFNEWAKTRENILGQNMMICESLLLASLFETLDDDEIHQVAETMSDYAVSMIRIRRLERKIVDETVQEFLSNFTRLVSSQHFGWFNKIDFSHNQYGGITLYGFHSLNAQYSKYAVELLVLILAKMYGYKKVEGAQNVTDNSFILELKPD
jgi:hypothetical protein